jgi:hypothetical protein
LCKLKNAKNLWLEILFIDSLIDEQRAGETSETVNSGNQHAFVACSFEF